MDTRDFILNLLEKNEDIYYDFYSKRYSMHEDTIGIIENELVKQFATKEEKEQYDLEFAQTIQDTPWWRKGDVYIGYYSGKTFMPLEDGTYYAKD